MIAILREAVSSCSKRKKKQLLNIFESSTLAYGFGFRSFIDNFWEFINNKIAIKSIYGLKFLIKLR